MAAKVALTQRSFARESVGFALGVGDWIISKSEKVSEISVFNLSNADEVGPLFKVSAGCLSLRLRRLQQKTLI